jgi:HK97 family phage major capsid protein
MFVKLLKDSDDRKKDDIYEVEDDEGKKLVEAGTAEETAKPEEIDLADAIKSVITPLVGEEVKAALRDEFKSAAKPRIEVGIDRTALDPTGGWPHAAAFLRDVYRAGSRSPALSETLAKWHTACKTAGHMAEGDDSQGGFLVPAQYIAQLKMNDLLMTGLASRCTTIPMATNTVSIPFVNETTHATSVFGGVIVYRKGEAEQKTASKPTFGLCTLTLHKLIAFTYVSDELLEDSAISIQPILGNMFPSAINWQVEDDIINGTGAGMGLGIVPAPATITVARAGAGAIARADILNMYRRMYPRSLGNSIWLANQDTMGQLQTLTQAVGTGGVATWIPSGGDSAAPYGTVLGRPIFFTELCPTLGNPGDIIFCDLAQMFLGRKAGAAMTLESSIHLRFDYDEVAFRTEMRYDCQPWWPAPLTPRYSAETLSPFVILGDHTTTTTAGE